MMQFLRRTGVFGPSSAGESAISVPSHRRAPGGSSIASVLGTFLVGMSLLAAEARAGESTTHLGSRASGSVVVSRTGNVFSLRFSGDEVIEYRLDLDSPNVRVGRVVVSETSSDSVPIADMIPGYRDANGGMHGVGWLASFATLTSSTMTGDSVVLDYTDDFTPIGEGVRHRRTTLTLKGKTLSLRFQDMDQSTSYRRNYIGELHNLAQGLDAPRVLRLVGGAAQPIVQFKNPSNGKFYYLNDTLDLFNSNASDYFTETNPPTITASTTALNYFYSTWNMYKPLTGGTQIAAPVDDTFRVTISSRIEDTFLVPEREASPYRELLANRLVMLLGQPTWSNFPPLWTLLDAWGLDNVAGYFFFGWSSGAPDAPSNQNMGPDWSPAVDAANFASAVQQAVSKGYLIGAYMAFNLMPSSASPAVYDSSHIARDEFGNPKLSPHDGLPTIASTASGLHAASEATALRNATGANMAYLDIQTYSSPSRGADGDHVDQTLGSPWAKTLRAACNDQLTWMRALQNTYHGPLLGESSISGTGSSYEFLWAGVCDSTQRVLNPGTNVSMQSLPATRRGWLSSITGQPVVPDLEWRVYGPLQMNHGNGLPHRFFAPSDGPAIVDSTGLPVLPIGETAMDRYRIYELTYGHTGYVLTNGVPNIIGNYISHADLVKEYHMTNALQSRYAKAPPTAIEYVHEGVFKTMQRVLEETGSLEVLRDARLRISFASGLVMWLNHSTQGWSVVVNGTAYTIPQDGFVATEPSTGFLAFSAIAPGTNGNRIDYAIDPVQYEYFDGRGLVTSYAGQSNPLGLAAFTAFSRGRTFRENTNATLSQVGTTNAPTLLRVEVTPATSTVALGSRKGYKAFAVYQNGARRDVTKLVTWSTGSGSIATVDSGAALTALGHGTTTLSVSSFGGAPVVGASVTVP